MSGIRYTMEQLNPRFRQQVELQVRKATKRTIRLMSNSDEKEPEKPKEVKYKSSPAEEMMEKALQNAGIEGWIREFKFHPERKWRSDFAFLDPKIRLLVEIDGGVFNGGRHTRGVGFMQDCEKINAAVLLGYKVMRFTTEHVANQYAVVTIKQFLKMERD